MVIEIISAFIIAGGGFLITKYLDDKIRMERSKISIKESIDLVHIPVVTFQEGDLKLNFLLDSGSTNSHVSASCAKTLIGTPINIENFNYSTSTGTDTLSKMIESVLEYKNSQFKVNLLVNENLDNVFTEIKEKNGVQLHGILGSDFLKEHKYVLDFSELAAYHKK